jgi:hypothetical protein
MGQFSMEIRTLTGSVLGGNQQLTHLMHMHPEAAEKIGPGIESFSVRTADYGTRCFWVNRVDGTTEKFSFRACY